MTPLLAIEKTGEGDMIWADRAGLGVAVLVFIGLFVGIGTLGVAQADQIWPVARVALVCGALVWVACRTIDFVIGGPFRRMSTSEKGQ